MLDYYVVTSLSAKSSEAEPFRTFYWERVAMYKALDRQQERRNWRPTLLEVLEGRLCLIPEVACKRKGRFTLGSARAAQPSAVSPDDLWAQHCALRGSPDCWQDRAAQGSTAVAAAPIRSITTWKAFETLVCASKLRLQVQEAAAAPASDLEQHGPPPPGWDQKISVAFLRYLIQIRISWTLPEISNYLDWIGISFLNSDIL